MKIKLINVLKIIFLLCVVCISGCTDKNINPDTVSSEQIVSNTSEIQVSVDLNEQKAQNLLNTMTLKEKVAQLFVVEPEKLLGGSSLITEYSGEKFAFPVGGVVFYSYNIKTPKQIKGLINGLQNNSEIPLFTVVDEEGG